MIRVPGIFDIHFTNARRSFKYKPSVRNGYVFEWLNIVFYLRARKFLNGEFEFDFEDWYINIERKTDKLYPGIGAYSTSGGLRIITRNWDITIEAKYEEEEYGN